ncbi:hypothetical protein Tco_0900872 [Tanacetum coccineum]
MAKTGLVEAIDSLVPLDEHFATFRGTDNQEKDEKQRQNDKTGLGMEKTVKDKAKSKPVKFNSIQKVRPKFNPGANDKEI